MSSKKIFFVSNYGLMYAASQILLEYAGIVPERVLHTKYSEVIDDLDTFLFEHTNHGDTIIFIGFNSDIEKGVRKVYSKHTGFKFLNNTDTTNSLHQSIDIFKKSNVSKTCDIINFARYAKDWVSMDFKYKESYILNVLFRVLDFNQFYSIFNKGYDTEWASSCIPYVVEHIKTFKAQSQNVYVLKGFYFVNSNIQYLDDYMYYYIPKLGNLSVIDTKKGRLYLRKHPDCEKDILTFANKVCDDTVGYKNLCSANISKTFLELTKQIKKYDL